MFECKKNRTYDFVQNMTITEIHKTLYEINIINMLLIVSL